MPSLPTACYRLQLRGGIDFAAAEAVLPWLAWLGISHLYLSPIFRAMPGSTHGYDVIDPKRIEDELGGRAGFEHLAEAARGQGIGLILDIVPNHMAFSPHNPWLRDVLRHGRRSRWFRHFDIRTDGPLLLPMLEAPFRELLDRGALAVEADPDGPVLVTGGLRVPLDPDTVEGTDIAALHERQFWRLVDWRTESSAIAHRRFFNITGLIGLRVEDEQVLADTHHLVFDLADAGLIAGLRIDHIDGLADPGTYLRRLRARLPDMPIWVEKIIAPGETLPDWPISGTTGYELARDIGQLLTDGAGVGTIDTLYRRETGRADDFNAVMIRAKREVLEGSLAAELWQLQDLLQPLVAADPAAREQGREVRRQALIGLIAHLDRYRPYLDEGARPEDSAALHKAAKASDADRRALDVLLACLTRPDAGDFRTRFQQVAGAVMAKGQEDRAFFRFNRLLSANEVGSDPASPAIGVADFHRRMIARAQAMPDGISLTSGHDTKRSEDARMRIAALAHHPQAMAALWQRAETVEGAADLDPNLRWYLVQSLWALHPVGGALAERLRDHAIKAMREAGEGTDWRDPDPDFEAAGLRFVDGLVAALAALPPATAPAAHHARQLSLAQLALKLTLPGIPDIYQGCEVAHYALTDPDNRAPVDFARLQRDAERPGGLTGLDADKLAMTRILLNRRCKDPDLLREGAYIPLPAPHGAISFLRQMPGRWLRVAVALHGDLPEAMAAAAPQEMRLWPAADTGAGGAAIAILAGPVTP